MIKGQMVQSKWDFKGSKPKG